jgi:uncharacterized protein (DUF1778 family)
METDMSAPARRAAPKRDAVINVRVSGPTRELIDSAAAVSGKSRTEFMLESAKQRAVDVLLDQQLFVLDGPAYAAFVDVLDNPPAPPQKLRELLTAKSPWEK